MEIKRDLYLNKLISLKHNGTKDIVPTYYDENGILTMNIYDFLLDAKSLEK